MTLQRPPSQLACPRCGVLLSMAQASDALLHGCSGCGGIWVDMQTSHRLCNALDGQTHALVESADKYASHAVDTQAPVACPVCQNVLARARLQNAGVEIDYCGSHGSWFDKGELVRIAQSSAVARAYGAGAPAATRQAAVEASSRGSEKSGIDGETVLEGGLFALELLLDLADGLSS